MKIDISVIMPTFKRTTSLRKAIDSVLNQSYENFELIVVDDNGINTKYGNLVKDIINLYNFDKRIKYVQLEKNSGGSIARNEGVLSAQGEYITFLDDDDEYYDNKLKQQIEFYKKYFPNNDGFINCQMNIYENNKYKRSTRSKVDYNNILFSAVSEKIIGTPSIFIPKNLLTSVGMFSKVTKGQEWDLVVKLISGGVKFLSMNEELVRVNVTRNSSITTDNNIERKINGLNVIYSTQQKYFDNFSKKQIRIIKNSYYVKIGEAMLSTDLRLSFKNFIFALRCRFFSVVNIRYLVKFFIRILSRNH